MFNLKNFTLLLLILNTSYSYSATVDSGLSDAKIKEFFGKLSQTQKNDILSDCKKDLGTAANGKSDAQLVDLCIAQAKSNIDPYDNYIDPDTLIDYGKEFDSYNDGKKKHILNRCTMFLIQNEMGQTGEASMTNAEIETYEKKVLERCETVLNKQVYGKDCTADNQEMCEEAPTLDSKSYNMERDSGDLLTFTLDQCVKRMQVTNANCEAPGGLLGASCSLDFRRQCFDFITQESTYFEDPNRELNTCANFEDQTRTLALECRSYCYQRQVCEITDEKFIEREIGNIYLRKKKGMSSCVKDKSFGVDGDNRIWVHQSCHGEFGIQYKEPDCGYRPTCEPTAFADESIPVSGKDETFVTCDGNGSPNPNDLDPRQNTESTGTVWCKAHLFKRDSKGNLTDDIDDSREISRITNLELIEKLGPHRCNPGGNGDPVDYLPKNKGNFDGGWGVEVMNYCFARFKLNVEWKQKMCTMAGEVSESGNTCCNGLVIDPETKVCNVPEYVAPVLAETEKIPTITDSQADGKRCVEDLSQDIVTIANNFFKELAVYENMFTILDGESDPINQISLKSEEQNKDIPMNRKLNNKAIKVIHDGALNFRTSYAKIKIDHEKLTNAIVCDMHEYMLINSVSLGLERVKELDIDLKKCETVAAKFAEVEAYFAKVAENNNQIPEGLEAPVITETNMLVTSSDIQEAAQLSQTLMIEANIAYITALMDSFDIYVQDLEKASLTGQNLVWYCAHKENCSEFNWLVKHAMADKFNTNDLEQRLKYRVITDFLHNPIYPTKLLTSKAKILPELEPGFKKYLYDAENYLKSEGEIASMKVYEPVINYFEGEMENVAQSDAYKSLFQIYGQEFPIRENSLLAEDSVFKEYVSKFESSTKYARGEAVDNKSKVIPFLCEKQAKTNFQVRVPMGKALVPLRMTQIAEFLYKYMDAQNKILKNQLTCTPGYNPSSGSSTGGTVTSMGNQVVDASLTQLANAISTARKSGGNISGIGPSNLLANRVLGVSGLSSTLTLNKNKKGSNYTSSGDSSVSDGQSNFLTARSARQASISKQVETSKKKRKDNLIGKYQESLGATYGKALSSQNGSMFNKVSQGFLNSGVNSNSNGSVSANGSGKNAIGSNGSNSGSGSGVKLIGGQGLKNSTMGSGKSYGKSSYGSGSSNGSSSSSQYANGQYAKNGANTGLTSQESSQVLNNIDNKEFDSNEDDSIFDIITKRYIRSAYPKFIAPKPTE